MSSGAVFWYVAGLRTLGTKFHIGEESPHHALSDALYEAVLWVILKENQSGDAMVVQIPGGQVMWDSRDKDAWDINALELAQEIREMIELQDEAYESDEYLNDGHWD